MFYFAASKVSNTTCITCLDYSCQGELLATYSEDNVHLFDPAACQRALSDVYCQQIAKYRDALASLQVGHLFRPLVVDGFGAWGTHAFAVMSTCASQCVRGNFFSCPRFFKRHHWRVLRSVSIMKALCEQSIHYTNHLLLRDHLSTDAAAGIAVDADALARSGLKRTHAGSACRAASGARTSSSTAAVTAWSPTTPASLTGS